MDHIRCVTPHYLLLLPLEAELSISKVLLPFTRQQAALLILKGNYTASGIIKCKFYCMLSLICCNLLFSQLSVSRTSMRNYI